MAAVEYAKARIREDRAELGRRLTLLMGDLAAVAMRYDRDEPWYDHSDQVRESLCGVFDVLDLCDRIDLLEEVANA